MEPSLGLRVVRGPNWRWEEQDGGEGFVGTVTELGREKKAVLVQWDCGTRAWYRSGVEGKFDLRVLDTAPTGLKFPEVVCSGCYAEGVAGTYWKCAHCYEYHLCHSCYLQGRHCREHPFFRIQSTKHTPRVKVSPRVDARQVKAKGIFIGAEVVRGQNWKFGDQDGGVGSVGRVTDISGWKDVTARSIAKVEWRANKRTNVYRVGHRGKVDLKCFTVGSWGHYYPEHLCSLGSDASGVFFNEDEIVAGDVITVTLEPDIFTMMQQSIGTWEDEMLQMLGSYGIVRSVLKHQRLYASFNLSAHVLCYSSATKLKHCRQGVTVQVTSDFKELHRLQSQESIWDDSLVTTLGQIGRVAEICINNLVEVTVHGKDFLYHPLCLSPASGESLEDEMDSQAKMCGSVVTSYRKNFRDQLMRDGITDVALLDGDVKTLHTFIYSNTSQLKSKKTLLAYYAITGMTPALNLVLKSGVDPNSFATDGGRTTLNIAVRLSNHLVVANLLVAGASLTLSHENPIYTAACHGLVSVMEMFVVHAKEHLNIRHPDNRCAPILFAALHGNSMVCNTLAAQECVKIDMETYRINIPLHAAVMHAYWDVMECLVGWGAKLNAANNNGETPLHVVVKLKSPIVPDSVRLRKVQREYSRNSGGKTAPGYVTVACFLVQEGADFHVKDKEGLSPYQILPPEVASLITAYVKIHPGSFHGSLRNTRLSKMCELPQPLQPSSGRGSTASAVGANPLAGSSQQSSKPLAGFLNTAEGKNEMLDSKAAHKNFHDLGNMKEKPPSSSEGKNVFFDSKATDKKTYDLATEKQIPPTSSSGDFEGSQQSDATAVKSSGNYNPNSASEGELCLLCEEQTASVKFSPCGHTVLCSVCAERAKKCYLCKATVATKTQ